MTTSKGPTTYVAPLTGAGLDPTKFEVGVHVLRKDGRPLTAEDIAACELAFPRRAAKPRTKKPATKTTTKRKAAKKP